MIKLLELVKADCDHVNFPQIDVVATPKEFGSDVLLATQNFAFWAHV
jgi:hypothetical protein